MNSRKRAQQDTHEHRIQNESEGVGGKPKRLPRPSDYIAPH